MLLLIGAVLLFAFLGEKADVFFILFVLVSTSLLRFFQERNAGRVVEKLQSLIAMKCTLVREVKMQDIPASNVVPGDVLVFNASDMITADCILLEAKELYTNEASLTGETFPVRESVGVVNVPTELSKRVNCLWEGTSIVSGKAKALVLYTADKTLFGSVVQSTSKIVETTLLLILFVMRTHKSLLKSRPGKYLFIFTAIGLVFTLGLPYMPFASGLGLTPLPPCSSPLCSASSLLILLRRKF